MNDQKFHQGLFDEIEARLAEMEPADVFKLRRDKWVLGAMAFGMALTLVPMIVGTQVEWFGYLSIAGVVIELCALGVFTYRQTRDIVPEFIDAKRKYATELDSHFVEFENIRRWLKTLAPDMRARHLAYIESRIESLEQRYPVVFGAADKLGVLPALIGVFLQFQAMAKFSLVTTMLGIAVVVMYVMAIWIAGFRLQLHTYARLLRSAERP